MAKRSTQKSVSASVSEPVATKGRKRSAETATAPAEEAGRAGEVVPAPLRAGPRGYPRPQLVRGTEGEDWGFLNETWGFAIDPVGELSSPADVEFTRRIEVPFAPETPLSGVEDQSYYQAVWYKRDVTPPPLSEGDRLYLHFGAVDYVARVYVDGSPVAMHEGGYSPFSVEVTEFVREGADLEVIVCATDDPHDLAKPRGKQDWHEKPHGIWYPRTTGIWQSVWWEVVPETHIARLRWYPDPLKFEVGFSVAVARPHVEGAKVQVRLAHNGRDLGEAVVTVRKGEAKGVIALGDPGIDDARNDLYWYPWHPRLIQAEIELTVGGEVLDVVTSYTALRHVKLDAGRFWLNGKPLRLDLVLDQGYWLEGGLTAPSDQALKHDVEMTKRMGFNGVRKHQKIEDPRFLYWADTLGLMVWGEFPGCYAFTPEAITRTAAQWMEAVQRDVSHPCVVAWVPFNESWGVPDLSDNAEQRALVDGVYHITKAYDPSRPVVGNDGWEMGETDILAVHDYDGDPERIKRRYADRAHFLKHEKPGNKVLVLEGYEGGHQPVMLTEFGGIAFSRDTGGTWGYTRARTPEDLSGRYARLLEAVRTTPVFGGFCYTQLTDTYQEANGLLYMDRTPKFDLRIMEIATRGARSAEEWEELKGWMAR